MIPWIDGVLESDQKAPRKQRHTAHRIWTRLKQERPEVEVAESTVRAYVRKRKVELGWEQGDVFVPQSYRWARKGRWIASLYRTSVSSVYEAYAEIDGEQQKVYVFCLRSMASGGAYHRAYPHAGSVANSDVKQ